MIEMERERRVLELLKTQYEENGYTFYISPGRELLPTFMKGYMPDAIALGEAQNVAIEVRIQRRPDTEKQLKAISERFGGQAKWGLRVVYANEVASEATPTAIVSAMDIEVQLNEAESLAINGHQRAAFILAWAALEAAAASAQDVASGSVGTRAPRQVLELLERLGRITFNQASALRNLVHTRNAVVHGDYSREVKRPDVETVISAVRSAVHAA